MLMPVLAAAAAGRRGLNLEARQADGPVAVRADAVAPGADSQQGGLDGTDLVDVAVDISKIEVCQQIRRGVITGIRDIPRERCVLLLVALQQLLPDFLAQGVEAVPQASCQL